MWERLLSRPFLVLILGWRIWNSPSKPHLQSGGSWYHWGLPLLLHRLENLVSQYSLGQHTGCTLCYTLSRQALGPQTPIPTAKLTQMVLLTHVTSDQTSWRWKTIYSSEQINHFRTSLGKFGMSHGSDAQEKSLSFACLLLFFLNSPCWLRNTCC